MPSVDDRAVQQLLYSVQVCDHNSFIIRTISVLLNCPLPDVYFIFYRLCLFTSSIFFSNGHSPTMYCYNNDLI